MNTDLNKIKYSFTLSFLFVAILWAINLTDYSLKLNLWHWGILPQSVENLYKIFTAPLIHADFYHLFHNSVALLFFMSALFYFFPKKAILYFSIFYILPGIGIWLIGRTNSYHIGISGSIFAMAAFELFVGIFMRKRELMAFSLIIIFLYGGMFWSIFPTKPQISWEGHLSGFTIGLIAAFVYARKYKRIIQKQFWEEKIETNEQIYFTERTITQLPNFEGNNNIFYQITEQKEQ